MELNVADGIVIAVLVISAGIGIYRGMVREILSLVTWIVAFYLAFMYGKDAGVLFSFVETSAIRDGLGIAAIFFAVLIMGVSFKTHIF